MTLTVATHRALLGREFVPSDIAGLRLWLAADRRASLTLEAGMAAQFVRANSEYLSRADNPSLSGGDVDLWAGMWVYLDTNAADMGLVSKYGASGSREWALLYSNGNNKFNFAVSGDGTNVTERLASSFGAPSTGTWIFILVWHDATANTINIQVNNGAVDSEPHTTGIFDSTAAFEIGRFGGANYLDGRATGVLFGKSPPGGITAIASTISTRLYNGGAGLPYADISPAEATAWGLVSSWECNEPSGTRADLHTGANTLTDNNTVTTSAGKLLTAVGAWADQSGAGNTASQATQANKMAYRASVVNGKPAIRGNGINSELVTAAAILNATANGTVILVINPQRLTGDQGVIAQGVSAPAVFLLSGSPTIPRFYVDNTNNASAGALTVGTPAILSCVAGAGVHQLFKNSVGGSASTFAGTTGSDVFQIGSDNGIFAQIDYAEILVYARALSANERRRAEVYLSRKWGIVI